MERRNVDGRVNVIYVDQLNRNSDQRFFGGRGTIDLKHGEGLQRTLEDPDAGDHRTDTWRLEWNTIEARRLLNDSFRYG